MYLIYPGADYMIHHVDEAFIVVDTLGEKIAHLCTARAVNVFIAGVNARQQSIADKNGFKTGTLNQLLAEPEHLCSVQVGGTVWASPAAAEALADPLVAQGWIARTNPEAAIPDNAAAVRTADGFEDWAYECAPSSWWYHTCEKPDDYITHYKEKTNA